MPLSRAKLINLAVEKYFIGCNNHDHQAVIDTFAENCVMKFSSAKYQYNGRTALSVHFKEFLDTFKLVNFHNFENVVDYQNQSIASQFTVDLEAHDGEKISMTNCNFFHVNSAGLFDMIMIYNSAPLQKGFEAGSN